MIASSKFAHRLLAKKQPTNKGKNQLVTVYDEKKDINVRWRVQANSIRLEREETDE
jgi:hypothetical protein